MEYGMRFLRVLVVFCFGNMLVLFGRLAVLSGWLTGVVVAALAVAYVVLNVRPRAAKGATRRLRALLGGYELLLVAFWAILATTLFYGLLSWTGLLTRLSGGQPQWMLVVAQALLFVPVILVLLVNGFFRVLLTCRRLRVVWRVLLFLGWWVPLFHLSLFYRVLKAARHEYYFELARLEMESVHEENQDCKTQYPIVLVHGIFFRDWQHLNYWGRIPQSLEKCGAQLYYGGQQSAAPVAVSAVELRDHIQEVLDKTGAEKVNLIAHSKGGLDSRYAISRLGLAPHVASLTTVNTPHRGCVFASHLLDTLPQWLQRWLERRYNSLFHALGDESPDFMGGVRDLSDRACAAFNEATPDAEGVYYQSVMSTMTRGRSAGFPLNLTWRLVNKYDREPNDGLVTPSSARWGHDLGCLTVPGKRGLSHGDVIDLLREDIPGFPVREHYIGLVKGLKEKGF